MTRAHPICAPALALSIAFGTAALAQPPVPAPAPAPAPAPPPPSTRPPAAADPGGGWRSVLGTVAAGDPAAVSPDYQEGVARLRAGDIAAGVDRLRVAFAQNPTSAAVAEELGVGLAKLGARREAESFLRKAIALDGRRGNAYVSLADLLSGSPNRWQRQAELAAFFAQGLTALSAVPDEGRGRQVLGIAVAGFEASVGQLADARRRLQTLLGEALPAALRQRAQARLSAIDEEDRARSLADWPEPLLPQADAAALAAAERALDGEGGRTGPAGSKDAQEALARITPLVERHPGSSRVRFLRARALHALERSDEEVRELRLVVQLRPSHARAWRMLGQTLALRGDVLEAERADEALRRALALEPSWDDLRELRERVARKRQGATDSPAAPAPPPPSDRARGLLDDAQRWIGVDAADVAVVSLREALNESPAFVEAAAVLYGLTGELPERTVQALWQHGPSLVRLGEALLRAGGDAETAAKTAEKVRPWLDRAAALGAPEARFVRALLLVEEGDTGAALAELAAYAASDVAPARLGEALALRGSLEATPEAGAPEARARTLLLAGRPDQAARLLGGVCRAGLGLSALLELGRIEEYEGRPARALDCYRMALGVAGEGNQASAASGRRAALERIALLGGYAPVETLPGFGAELERAAQAGVIGAEWALARLHTHAERWSLALARANAFLARAPADDPLRPRAEAALVDLRRRDDDVRWWRRVGLWGAVGAVALLALALLVRSLRRRRAWDVDTAIERAPDFFPEVAAVVAEVRHDILKHRASALGLLDDASAGANRREEIRRLLLEPAPASTAVIGAYERLQRAAGAVGIVLRPLEREPVFGPLVQALARVEALLDRPIQGRDAGRDVGGEQEIAALDRELRERHGPALARLAAAAPRTRLDPAQVAGWMRQLAPRGAAGRAPQPGLHLPALDVELPLTEAAVHTILSNLVRNAMAAVAQAGERGGEARVLVRLEEERDAVGRRLVTLLVADSAGASLSLEEIERRDGQRGLGIVRDLVRRWGGHLVVRPERPPLVKAIGAAFPRAADPSPATESDAGERGRRAAGGTT